MNEQSRLDGTGSYDHVRGSNEGWGHLTVHVQSRERDAARLLVDGLYTRQRCRDVVATAWIWEMRPPRRLVYRPLIDVPLPGRY
jgi:hypothetical protein